jgi:hypothetical protein
MKSYWATALSSWASRTTLFAEALSQWKPKTTG